MYTAFCQLQTASRDEQNGKAGTCEDTDQTTHWLTLHQSLDTDLWQKYFDDASHEGDGLILYRCSQFVMLHFREEHCSRCVLEGLTHITQVGAVLPPNKLTSYCEQDAQHSRRTRKE